MKVIIAGSRDLNVSIGEIDRAVEAAQFSVSMLVSGGASGIDRVGEMWARSVFSLVRIFPADWETHGRAAGPIRNAKMASFSDALIAIYRKGKLTPGTRSMISEARKRGLKIYEHVI